MQVLDKVLANALWEGLLVLGAAVLAWRRRVAQKDRDYLRRRRAEALTVDEERKRALDRLRFNDPLGPRR